MIGDAFAAGALVGVAVTLLCLWISDALGDWRKRRLHRRVDRLLLAKGETFLRNHYKT